MKKFTIFIFNIARPSLLMCFLLLSIIAYGQTAVFKGQLKKAKDGDCLAQIIVGEYYYNGHEGANVNFKEAFKWFKKALENKHLDDIEKRYYYELCNYIGQCYNLGRGTSLNFKEAVKWFEIGAQGGDSYCISNLGLCYEKGQGVEKDEKKAWDLNMKSAEMGNPFAMFNLGVYLYYGIGRDIDYKKAVYWYRKAADMGNANAQNNLGLCYHKGQGVDKDDAIAKYWWTMAARQGQQVAKRNLSLVVNVQMSSGPDSITDNNITVAKKESPDIVDVTKEKESVSMVDKNIPSVSHQNSNCFAVIIGNEKYESEVDVPFAENDARIFKEYAIKTLGIPEKQIKYVANGTLNGIRMAIRWLTQAMGVCNGQGQAIFYYAGHGIPDEANKSAYLLPVDGFGSDPESAYSLNRLYNELGAMPAQSVTVFLDACFSGAKREGGMLASARGVAIKVKQSTPKGKMIVFTAAQGDETAHPYNEEHHGMFTFFLLKKLQETKGDITYGDLGDYLTNEVKRQSFVENGKQQTPSVMPSASFSSSWRKMKIVDD